MAYNFKKINDVPVVEAMKNDLNVFVEDGRKMAKIPANKMIPEDVALKSDIPEIIPVPATAEVGQVMAVKAVDENGKPTEWEAVDAGGGSGGVGSYQLVFFSWDDDKLYWDDGCTKPITMEEGLAEFLMKDRMMVITTPNRSTFLFPYQINPYNGGMEIWVNKDGESGSFYIGES